MQIREMLLQINQKQLSINQQGILWNTDPASMRNVFLVCNKEAVEVYVYQTKKLSGKYPINQLTTSIQVVNIDAY